MCTGERQLSALIYCTMLNHNTPVARQQLHCGTVVSPTDEAGGRKLWTGLMSWSDIQPQTKRGKRAGLLGGKAPGTCRLRVGHGGLWC